VRFLRGMAGVLGHVKKCVKRIFLGGIRGGFHDYWLRIIDYLKKRWASGDARGSVLSGINNSGNGQ